MPTAKKDIAESMQCEWRRRQYRLADRLLWILLALMFLFCLINSISSGFARVQYDLLAFAVAVAAVCGAVIPFSVHFRRCYRQILERAEGLPYHVSRLENPHKVRHQPGKVCFSVTLSVDGQLVTVDTDPMFSHGLLATYDISEYENRRIRLYYDEARSKVYLIG